MVYDGGREGAAGHGASGWTGDGGSGKGDAIPGGLDGFGDGGGDGGGGGGGGNGGLGGVRGRSDLAQSGVHAAHLHMLQWDCRLQKEAQPIVWLSFSVMGSHKQSSLSVGSHMSTPSQ